MCFRVLAFLSFRDAVRQFSSFWVFFALPHNSFRVFAYPRRRTTVLEFSSCWLPASVSQVPLAGIKKAKTRPMLYQCFDYAVVDYVFDLRGTGVTWNTIAEACNITIPLQMASHKCAVQPLKKWEHKFYHYLVRPDTSSRLKPGLLTDTVTRVSRAKFLRQHNKAGSTSTQPRAHIPRYARFEDYNHSAPWMG